MRFTRAAAELLYRRGRHVSKNYREIFARRGERPRVLLLTEFSASPCGLREIHGGYTRQSRCERTNFPNILAPPPPARGGRGVQGHTILRSRDRVPANFSLADRFHPFDIVPDTRRRRRRRVYSAAKFELFVSTNYRGISSHRSRILNKYS